MWPPRFAPSSSPPNTQSRSASLSSTAPRRPSHLGPYANSHPRPQFSPRTSSLNVSAKFNTSTASLNSPRNGPGSGLKQEVLPTPNTKDPLNALEELIGTALAEIGSQEEGDTKKKPAFLIEEVEFRDVGLRELALDADDHQSESLPNEGANSIIEECE